MNEHDKRKQELLQELARRFRDSANNLRDVARRINAAAQLHETQVKQMNHADEDLRACIESDPSLIPFTYLEFVEFSNAEEFKKFKNLNSVTAEEIDAVDLDTLIEKLQRD